MTCTKMIDRHYYAYFSFILSVHSIQSKRRLCLTKDEILYGSPRG